jgi:hypothetical protein
VVKRRLSFVIVLSCVLVATATGALAFSEKKSLYDYPGFLMICGGGCAAVNQGLGLALERPDPDLPCAGEEEPAE